MFDALDVTLEPFALCEIRGAASLGLGRRSHAVLHYVLAGQGEITIDGFPPIPAAAGSVILIPAFAAHSLNGFGKGKDTMPDCRPLDVAIQHFRTGSGEGVLAAICGRVSIVYRGQSGTMDLLNAPIIERLDSTDRVRGALEDLVTELASPTIGTRALARVLLLQSIILLLRRRLQAGDTSLAWMQGLGDETLWGALRAMLDHPDRNHTVDTLAELAGMSRATFASRFNFAYGNSPIELLRTIRLRRAAELLATTDLPTKRIAQLVGYESRTYFSRAFKCEHGLAPGTFRRHMAEPENEPNENVSPQDGKC